MKSKLVILINIILSSCSTFISSENISSPSISGHVGSRLNILKKNDLSKQINLNKIKQDNLFAIGPVENLKGEITVYGGTPFISSFDSDGSKVISQDWNTNAIFLAYVVVKNWSVSKHSKNLLSLSEIESFVKRQAIIKGLNINKAFPFRIEGTASRMIYHIIYKKDQKPHNKIEHIKAKQKFKLRNTKVNIVGFWAPKKEIGIYTHPGKHTHLHFISDDTEDSGHIDMIQILENFTLYFPKP